MEIGLVVLWLGTLLVLGAVALPATAALLPDLEHGAFAIPVALAVLGVVGHLVGHLAFAWPALLAGLVVLVGGSLLAARHAQPDRRSFAEAAVVFAASFLFVVALRAVAPAAAPLPLAIGEKFLDFGLLRTLERSSTLPPQDMWFAGQPVKYYYGGHLLTVLLATLTDTAARFAYNLGLATFYAALVTAAYGLAGSIAAGRDASRRLAGVLGAVFVGLAGNLEPAAQLVLWLLPAGVANWLVGLLGISQASASWTPSAFWYFDASRVLPVDPSAQQTFQAATEFPLFAWLNADLHAHMMSQPFVLLAAALLLGYWRADSRWRRRALVFGALPAVAGLLSVVNLWSFPTVGGLAVLAVTFAPGDPARLFPDALAARLPPSESAGVEEVRRVGLAVGTAVVVLVLGAAWALPFWLGPMPRGRGLAPWPPWSPLGGLFLVHGAFLAAFVPYLARRAGAVLDRPRLAGGIAVAVALVAVLVGAPALALLPVLAVAWWLLRARADVGFETVLILAGLGLVLLVEVVTVDGERFNTIFKPYVDVWLFWAVATAVVLTRLADGAGARAPSLGATVDRERWRRTGIALTVVILLSTGVYAGFALPAHFADRSQVVEQRGPTLDATAYLEVHYPGEAPAIRWLDAREGQPVIVTAAPGGYRWRPDEGKGASAPASLTGLPTVLGWQHERQYRGPDPYQRRLQDVRTIYEGTPDQQSRLLERYDVRYVYVGPVERSTYDLTIDDHPGLDPVFRGGDVVIYAVDRDRLSG
ncbi:MAG: DUF2298 domain-containing protein [Haloarculaceae archaeon]